MARVELRGVTKTFPGGVEAVAGIDLAIGDDEFLAIVGPSGSGKSTLLRLIAGLEAPGSGEIWIGDRRADRLAPRDRDAAMVFQEPALYPHLDAFENIAFGLRARRTPTAEVAARVEEAAAILGLSDLLRRRPATLSGGQRQRVALARAVARRPGLILLDEPLSNLDAPLRAAIRADLIDLHRRLGTTTLLVTHDQAEALAVGDRVAVMDRGRLVQVGPPMEVHDRPASRFVARFIGGPPMNLLTCAIEREGDAARLRVVGLDASAIIPRGATWAAALLDRGRRSVEIGIRPEHLELAPAGSGGPPDPGAIDLTGTVARLEPTGHETLAALACGPYTLSVRLGPRTPLRVGDPLPIRWPPRHSAWFDPETGRALT